MTARRYTVGVDFGTESARGLILDIESGAQVATSTHSYAHGVIDRRLPSGEPLGQNWALQHPHDYLAALEAVVSDALSLAGICPGDVVGLGTDFTACTFLPAYADGTPLCVGSDHAADPHSWVKLWKHHAAQAEADHVNAVAEARNEPWRHRYGGKQSAEWQLAKALEVYRCAPEIFAAADRWVEAADWIVWQLTGRLVRSVALAGYKGARQDSSPPSAPFLEALEAGFSALLDKLDGDYAVLGAPAGTLRPEMASRLGLTTDVVVCVGNVDAHVAAPAARTLPPGRLLAVMGTSTCHILNGNQVRAVPGICGVVDGGVVDGTWGYEAGQSGVGDVFAWVTRTMTTNDMAGERRDTGRSAHEILTSRAAALDIGEHGLVALDWLSGNRSVLVDHELSGAVIGLGLATEAHHVYRAMLEATVFGTRMIIEGFEDAGVAVDEIVATGGLVVNDLLMQLTADITGRTVRVASSEQGPALGSAIHAAVAAGAFLDVASAAEQLAAEPPIRCRPDDRRHQKYAPLFEDYRLLHDYFGREQPLMKRLRQRIGA